MKSLNAAGDRLSREYKNNSQNTGEPYNYLSNSLQKSNYLDEISQKKDGKTNPKTGNPIIKIDQIGSKKKFVKSRYKLQELNPSLKMNIKNNQKDGFKLQVPKNDYSDHINTLI